MFPAPILVSGFTSCRRIGLSKDSSSSSGVVARAALGFVASSASEQLTALRARRRWRGRCAPGRLRQPGRGHALRARRRWRGRCAPGRLRVFPPDNAPRCLLVVGMLKTSCASR